MDDLQFEGLVVIRSTDFGYGQDAVLLANALKAKPGQRGLDMCCGCGVIGILAQKKTGASFTLVDIQGELCDMARRSVELNGQQEQITVLNADIRKLSELLVQGSFDVACCNPPYYKGGTVSCKKVRRLSTHQEECSMEDVAYCAAKMLKNGGRFYMSYPAEYLAVACAELIKRGLQPKCVTPVCGRREKPPYLVLIEAKKGAAPGMTLQNALTLEDE